MLIWRHIYMQGRSHVEITASSTSGNGITSPPKLDAKRYKLGFHLCSNSIWILRPEMNPGHLSHPWPPSFPQTPEKWESRRGTSDETWPPAAPCASVANFQNSLTFLPPPHPWKLMGSFWFGYGDSTVREPPSGFLLTWVRCEPVATAR